MNTTNKYLVTITPKYPAAYCREATVEIEAATHADALKAARRDVYNAGHTRRDGPVYYKARRVY